MKADVPSPDGIDEELIQEVRDELEPHREELVRWAELDITGSDRAAKAVEFLERTDPEGQD